VFINPGEGGATRITDIVLSTEVQPGHQCRQFTPSSACVTTDPAGMQIQWYKFVATVCMAP
jgi:hypothetical protein